MIWTSEQEPVEAGGTTVHELLRSAAAEHGGRTALLDGEGGASLTYDDLLQGADRVSGWLRADGFAPGDRMALWAPNVPSFALLVLGTLQAGGAVTTLNPAAAEREVVTQIADAGASLVATVPELVPSAVRLGVRRVVVLGHAPGAVPLAEVLASTAPAARPDVDPSTVALLPYSSGTTGLPKGVMLTHANLVTVCRQLSRSIDVRASDVTLALAPFFHILGFTAELMVPLSAGATVVTQARFDPAVFLDLLEGHRVSYLAVPPPVAALLARHPAVAQRDLRSLQLVASGGAPLPAALQVGLEARLPWCAVGQGWGLTETSGAISVPRRGEGARPGTVGRLLANTELRVVDSRTGEDIGPHQDGELLVRGPQVMAGYLGQPEATAEMVDADGWLRTGDLGHVDGDGNIVITARLKELIKVNAYQVAPAELEGLLLGHPAVADVAVIAQPDDRTGEAPVAVVVPRPGTELDADALRGWLAERVAPYKRLRAVRTAASLPRTPSGKLLRRLLVDATPEPV